jgi:hypothetical protein
VKDSTFGLLDERKYPMPTWPPTLAVTRRRASQQVKQGNLSKADERKIDRKADRILTSEARTGQSRGPGHGTRLCQDRARLDHARKKFLFKEEILTLELPLGELGAPRQRRGPP